MSKRLLACAYAFALVLPGLLVLLGPRAAAEFMLYACGFVGLASLMMLTIQFVTSGRFERLAAPFGLDVIMGFHRFAGRALLFAIAAHVVLSVRLAAGDDLTEIPAVVRQFITDGRLATGLIAFILLLQLIWSAGKRNSIGLKYEWWRLSHGIGALILLLLAAHHAWTNAVFLRAPAVVIAVLAGLFAALASFIVIYGVRAVRSRNADWKVEGIQVLGPGLHEVSLSQASPSRFTFRAGQFVWVTFGRRHPVTDHPFSIASAPAELPKLRLIVKENGDFTRLIGALPLGTPAYLDGPHGSFTLDRGASWTVLIAGGVGIAPVLSILRSLASENYAGRTALIVAAHSESDHIFLAEIDRIADQLDILRMFVVEQPSPSWKGQRGCIDASKLERFLSGVPVARADILMCGPLPMMEAVSPILLRLGASTSQIRYERFDYHAGYDPKSRSMRRRFVLLLAVTCGLVLLAASAGAYFS